VTFLSDKCENPYAAPGDYLVESSIDQTLYDDTQRYPFDVEITPDDLKVPAKKKHFVAILFLVFALLLFSARTEALHFRLAIWVGVGVLLWAAYALLPGIRVRRLVKQSPGLLDRKTGFVSEYRMVVQCEHYQSGTLMSALTEVVATDQKADFHFNNYRILPRVLPKRGFNSDEDYWKVVAIAESKPGKKLKPGIADSRIVENPPDYPLPPVPGGSVLFRGSVIGTDPKGTSFEKIRIRAIIRISIIFGLAYFLLVSLTFSVLPSTILIVWIIGWLLFLVYIYWKSVKSLFVSDKPLMQINGGLFEGGVATSTAIGNLFYRWEAFKKCEVTERCILLPLVSSKIQFLILSRSMFKSEDDWNEAQRLSIENARQSKA